MNNQKYFRYLFLLIWIIGLGISIWFMFPRNLKDPNQNPEKFDGNRAENDIKIQVGYGPRVPGSSAHSQTIKYIQGELDLAGWDSVLLKQKYDGKTAYNILATRKDDPVLVLGAHYDSRLKADADNIFSNRTLPVPGANDGASGTAVLLEIARSLSPKSIPTALLFIDIEDNGHLPGWDWIQGSRAFVENMNISPSAVIIVDMIGDSDLNIFMEKNSDKELTAQIWSTAKKLGYEKSFIPEYKYQVLDDHIPFIENGIRAVDIIDLDYPYWHTTQDTPDKISAKSLQIVGDTLLTWIKDFGPCIKTQVCNSP